MYQLCAVKSFQQNETIFMILDDWMKKYNTSPKPLVIAREVDPSLSMNKNSKQNNLIENKDIIEALKKWATQNQKIVVVSAAAIVVFTVSTAISKAPINAFKNQIAATPTILFSQDANEQNEEAQSTLTAGVYYADEQGAIRNENQDISSFLAEGDMDIKGNKSIALPGSDITEKAFRKDSAYHIFDEYMQSKMEEASLPPEDVSVLASTEPESISKEEVIVETSILANGNAFEIVIPTSVKQTGLCPNFTSYTYFYGKWNRGTQQRELSEQWYAAGMPSSNGIATLNDRYLVAVSPKFGKVGDNIDIVLRDGQVIHATIADAKGVDATSEWGHVLTQSGAVDIIEWEGIGSQEDINLGSWKNVKVEKIINFGKEIAIQTAATAEEILKEVDVVSTEEAQYIQLYSSVYGLNEEKVYQIISGLTDNFTSNLYCSQNIIEGSKLGDKNIPCDSKEMAILLCIRNIYQNPEQYGVTLEEIKGPTFQDSTSNYAKQIEHAANVLGVDPSLNYAICQASCGFSSPMFVNKNNPTNIMIDGTYATFPTKEAGFIEQTIEILEMQLSGEKIIKSIGIRAKDNGLLSWEQNVLEIYNYVSKNYNSIFDTTEEEKLEKQNLYVLS